MNPELDERVVRIGDSLFVNADCVDGSMAHLANDSVDLIITDPPYGIGGDRLHKHYNRDESFVVDGYIEIPATDYNAFSHRWVREAERVLRPGGSMYIVSGYTNLYDILDALRGTRLREINHIIWKYNFGVYTSAKYVSSHYHILFYEKPGAKRTFNLQSRFSTSESHALGGSSNYRDREDVWIINREYKPGQQKNKNELPSALLLKMMQYSSNPGDLVCDFFMGGCSTAAVAIGMNRRFTGFEASEKTFKARVPTINAIRPGEMLEFLTAPTEHVVENRGKSWDENERVKAVQRFDSLRRSGTSKKDAIAIICDEFGRGHWSVAKLIKRYGNEAGPLSSGGKVMPDQPRLIPL